MKKWTGYTLFAHERFQATEVSRTFAEACHMADNAWRALPDDIKQLYKDRASVLPPYESRVRIPVCPECFSRQIVLCFDSAYCYRCWADGFEPEYIFQKKKSSRRVYAPQSIDRRFG